MEELLNDLVAHNIQNRTVAIIENGSWAATSGKLMRELLSKCKNINILEQALSIKSSLKESQLADLDAIADGIAADFPKHVPRDAGGGGSTADAAPKASVVDVSAMFKLSYGLFVLTAKDGSKDNGCIINTVAELTEKPLRISIAVNKANYTHDIIVKTGVFNVSTLSESAPFKVFEHFGFHSGRDTDKFADCEVEKRTSNGVLYLPKYTNSVISGKVTDSFDYGTHTLFIADVTQSFVQTNEPSMTYQYYFDNVKPKPQKTTETKKGFVCKICAYFYEGDTLPPDFICPLCKHGAADFERA